MIQLTRSEIRFSLPEQALLLDGDSRKLPLVRELLSGHVCPNCGIVTRALYKTEKPLKQLTREYFELDKDVGPEAFATATTRHEVKPRYKTVLLEAGGATAELIREAYHFNTVSGTVAGRCPYWRVVHYPGRFEPRRYLLGLAQIVFSGEWYKTDVDHWNRLRRALYGLDPDTNSRNAEQLYNELKKYIKEAEDVSGNGAPLWLLSKNDWGYYTLARAVEGLPR